VDNLYKILLSTVLRQNANNTTSPTNAFNLNSTAVQAYLTQKLKGILPNTTSGNITENELMTAWLLANSGGAGGTVTSVDITSNAGAITITGNPITTAGTIDLSFNGAITDYVDGTGALQVFPTSLGTVTSVDLTMPSAFAVTGNPITTAGTLAVTGAGTTGQYIRGDGSLAVFPSITGGGASVSYYLNGSINQGTFSGNTYYQMNKTAVIGTGTNFTIATNGYISQFITDANDPSQLNIPQGNWNFELYFQASSPGGSPSFYVELYKYNGSFTLIASSSANPEGITNGTAVDLYYTALAVPATTLALTDRLAVRVYVNNSGRTITLHTEDSNLCQVTTTFSTGITALNGLTAQVQTFAIGTSGTDFNISSATSTHTFNLPVASATNTGKLSNSDFTTFNNKVTSLGAGTGISIGGTTTVPTVTNTLPDQTVVLTAGTGIGVTGTYPNFTITNSSPSSGGTVTSVAALTLGTTGTDLSSTVANSTTTPVITLNVPTASALNRGALSAADWTTFNSKGNGTVTSIATAGLISGGTITSTGTITTSVSTNKLVGRATAGTGVMEEITLGTGLSFTGTTLNATGGGLTVGTTAIASGTAGRILFEGAGNVLQENAILNLDTTNGLIIGGTTARATRLTAINAANTAASKTLVVRNAADSADIFTLTGDGKAKFVSEASSRAEIYSSSGGVLDLYDAFGRNIQITATNGAHGVFVVAGGMSAVGSSTVGVRLRSTNASTYFLECTNSFSQKPLDCQMDTSGVTGTYKFQTFTASSTNYVQFNGGNGSNSGFSATPALAISSNRNVGINNGTYGTSAVGVLAIGTGTAPSGGNPADAFQLYSADIVANNAAPHFQTENGDVIKIYSIGGWGTPTGTLTRTTFATYAGATAGALYDQTIMQNLIDAAKITSERLAALISDLKTGQQLLKA